MKRVLITFSIIIVFVFGVYGYVWYETYQNTKVFFTHAEENYEKEAYALAIKGGETYNKATGSYEAIGGYEEVLGIWSNPYAIPKPDIYYQAKDKIDSIIYEKLSADEGFALFQQYFQLDNDFLPEILIQSGILYKDSGQEGKAKAIFELAIDAFGMKDHIREQAEQHLQEMK